MIYVYIYDWILAVQVTVKGLFIILITREPRFKKAAGHAEFISAPHHTGENRTGMQQAIRLPVRRE